MYYEEKMIDGVLCWRGSPNEGWTPFTIEQLSNRLVKREKALQAISGLINIEFLSR